MNTKNIKKINHMKSTRFGKLVCRLMGEETGAVMMEYVIVTIMIAAAVAVGAWLFGAQILGLFGVAGDGAMGRDDKARQNIQQIQGNKNAQDKAALKAAKDFPVAKEESTVKDAK